MKHKKEKIYTAFKYVDGEALHFVFNEDKRLIHKSYHSSGSLNNNSDSFLIHRAYKIKYLGEIEWPKK